MLVSICPARCFRVVCNVGVDLSCTMLQESDVTERIPVAVCPEATQDPRSEASEIQPNRVDPVDPASERFIGCLPSSSGSQSLASSHVDYGGSATCPVSLASWSSQTLGAAATSRTRGTMEESAIWYNPIPEEGHLARPPQRRKTSRAQWYVEVPSPTGAGPPSSDRVGQHGGVDAVSAGTDIVQEQRVARCATGSSPPPTHRPSVPVACVSWSGGQTGSSAQKPT
ncbi:hypothetical protein chiPu_0022206, partial [Chiloscyllium punctatum]|nr:hypothetical protein [Chiloscyllium punctatum]